MHGATALRLPTIAITGPADPPLLAATLATHWAQATLAIFVSVNAVQHGLAVIDAWPARLRVAAIGARTAQALTEHGHPPDIQPLHRFDSEALLEDPRLQSLAGERILILRGTGGRELLAHTLRARGAQVTYAEVYRRVCPSPDLQPLQSALAHGRLDALTFTSGETLENLLTILAQDTRLSQAEKTRLTAALLQTPAVVGGERLAALARQRGWQGDLTIADDPTDAAMLRGLLQFFQIAPTPFPLA